MQKKVFGVYEKGTENNWTCQKWFAVTLNDTPQIDQMSLIWNENSENNNQQLENTANILKISKSRFSNLFASA